MARVPIGQLIRSYRSIRGLRVEDIAAACGVGPRYMWMIETGTRMPSLDVLYHIADALDVPVHLLMLQSPTEADSPFSDIEDALLGELAELAVADLADITTRLDQAREHWALAMEHYRAALAMVPRLLRESAHICLQQGGPEARQTAIEALRLAEAVVRPVRPDLAVSAAARAKACEQPS